MQTNIVITAIVKNESERIQQTLKQFLDEGFKNILILDTGSEDDTCQKITQLSSDIIIGHSEFRNYSHDRNIALDMCKDMFENSDFIFMIDCEWYVPQLQVLKSFCQENRNLEKKIDCFEVNVLVNGKICNPMKCLFRTKGSSRYEGEIHEIATGYSGGIVPNFTINVIQTEYGLNKTKKRNLEIDIPYYLSKNNRSNSETFFLAQAYHNIKKYDDAIKYYNELTEKENFQYISCYRIAEINFILGEYEIANIYYFKCFIINNERCEPLIRLSQLCNFGSKYILAKLAYNNGIIPKKSIFVEVDCYNYYRYLELIKSCIVVKKYKEGLDIVKKYCVDNAIRITNISQEMFFYKNVLERKIVILILTSPGYEEYNKIMSEYLSKFCIEFYFYSYSECCEEINIIGNNIYIPGKETFIPGILNKTIEVFRLFSHYDYIMRINSTTFIDMIKVNFGIESYDEYLKIRTNVSILEETSNESTLKRKNFDYYGFLNSASLRENPEYGITKEFLDVNGSIPFVSGKCIILSKKAVNDFLLFDIDRSVMDDISIALSMNKSNYKIDHVNSFNSKNSINIMTICQNVEIMRECVNNFLFENSFLN